MDDEDGKDGGDGADVLSSLKTSSSVDSSVAPSVVPSAASSIAFKPEARSSSHVHGAHGNPAVIRRSRHLSDDVSSETDSDSWNASESDSEDSAIRITSEGETYRKKPAGYFDDFTNPWMITLITYLIILTATLTYLLLQVPQLSHNLPVDTWLAKYVKSWSPF